MKAVVLVGGEGTRLRPLTYTTPKPLLPIANQVFLERQLAWMGSHGIDEVVLSLGYLPDAFLAHFPDGRFGDMRLTYAVEPEPLGTAGAIRFAAEHAGIGERFVVCNGDVLTSLDLGRLVEFHAARRVEVSIHLVRVPDPSAFGVVPAGPSGEVLAFVEKPVAGAAPSDWINAGTYVLEPSVLDRIPSQRNVSIERETFPQMLEADRRLYAWERDVYWIDIGTPDKYRAAHADVIGGALGVPPVAGAQERQPGVWLEPEVHVDPSARLVAPVLVGRGSSIGPGVNLTAASVGAGCTVEAAAQVRQSVLHDGVHVGASAQVVDSLVGRDARIDAGEVVEETIRVAERDPHSSGVS